MGGVAFAFMHVHVHVHWRRSASLNALCMCMRMCKQASTHWACMQPYPHRCPWHAGIFFKMQEYVQLHACAARGQEISSLHLHAQTQHACMHGACRNAHSHSRIMCACAAQATIDPCHHLAVLQDRLSLHAGIGKHNGAISALNATH